MLSSLRQEASGDPCDWRAVLPALLDRIAPESEVSPTENYFYFQFHQAGRAYAGSLRLAVDTRDAGVVEYACYPRYERWLRAEDEGVETDLDKASGVRVRKAERLVYEITYAGRTARLRLNDLPQVSAAPKGADERFAGRLYDESGLLFELVYDTSNKTFFFVLDVRDGVAERFVSAGERLILGKRTGFLFYKDEPLDRWILVAVEAEEVHLNSWYDGPFDQLPENFFQDLGFWDLVFDAYPELRGELTPGGVYKDEGLIFAVKPYRLYKAGARFDFVRTCTEAHPPGGVRIACLTGSSPTQPQSAAP